MMLDRRCRNWSCLHAQTTLYSCPHAAAHVVAVLRFIYWHLCSRGFTICWRKNGANDETQTCHVVTVYRLDPGGPCTPDFSEFNRAPPQMTQSCSHHCAQLLLGEGQHHIPDMQ